MKKFFTLFAALFALTLVACDDSDDQIQEPVVPKAELTLTSEATMEFEAAGGNGEITYTLKNPVQGVQLEASCPDSWVTNLNAGDKITFTVASNTDTEARSTKITAKYQQKSFEVTINQAGATQQPEEPTITVSVEKVSVTGETVNFKVTSSGATKVKWMMIPVNPNLPAPDANTILNAAPSMGILCGEVEANTTAEASAKAPTSGMDYAVYVAATDGKASIVSEPLVWTPGEGGGNEEPEELGVELVQVSQNGDTLNFIVASSGATKVKWMMVMATMGAPDANTILNADPSMGMLCGEVEANTEAEASITAPMTGMEFAVYAAATDGTNNVVSEPLKWTPTEGGNEPEELSVELVQVSQNGDTLNFIVASSGATKVKWMMAMAMMGAPDANTILNADPQFTPCGEVEANTEAEVSAKAPMTGMEFAVYAVATDGTNSVVSEPLKWTPTEGGNEPEVLGVEVTKISQNGTTMNFMVTSSKATKVKWMMAMAAMGAPDANTILNADPSMGMLCGEVEANTEAEASVTAPVAGMEFAIYAAATDGTNSVVSEPLVWTPGEGGGEEPEPEPSKSFSTLAGDLWADCIDGNAVLMAECYGLDEDYGTNKYLWAVSIAEKMVETEDGPAFSGHFVMLYLLSESATDIVGEYTVLADPTAAGNFFAPGWGEWDGEEAYINDSMWMNLDTGDQAPLTTGKIRIQDKGTRYEIDTVDTQDDAKHILTLWYKVNTEKVTIIPAE